MMIAEKVTRSSLGGFCSETIHIASIFHITAKKNQSTILDYEISNTVSIWRRYSLVQGYKKIEFFNINTFFKDVGVRFLTLLQPLLVSFVPFYFIFSPPGSLGFHPDYHSSVTVQASRTQPLCLKPVHFWRTAEYFEQSCAMTRTAMQNKCTSPPVQTWP